MYQKLLNQTYKLEQNRFFIAIRSGLMFLIPVLIIGSITLAIQNFPVPAFTGFLNRAGGGMIRSFFNLIYDATFGLMAVYLCCGVAYFYAKSYPDSNESFRLMALITSLGCFILSFGAVSGTFLFSNLGALGIAPAIFCALAATSLFHVLSVRLPFSFRSYTAGADQQFHTVVAMIIPVLLTLTAFSVVILLLQAMTGAANFNDLLAGAVTRMFASIVHPLARGILFVVMLNGLWFFGIHGGNVLEQVAVSFFEPFNLDPTAIISKSFLDNFALIGGSGTALCLLLALLLFSRSKNSRRLAWASAPFAVFNMSELLIFGFPAILNPLLLIPFLLTPVLSLCIAYAATVSGFLPVVNETIVWSTPVLFSGYAAVHSVRGVLVQLVILLCGTLFYAPFIRLSEYLTGGHERLLVEEFSRTFWKEQELPLARPYLGRPDQIGVIAKTLTGALREDIQRQAIPVQFQPQFNENNQLVGAETLLRWTYHDTPIAPPITCQLAQEDGLFDALTEEILKQAAAFLAGLKARQSHLLHPAFSLSINVSAAQVNDAAFIQRVIALVSRYGIENQFCLEITEEESLEHFDQIEAHLAQLKAAGVQAAIDDFSMGRTSIKYLQHNNFQYVKLDGALVRGLEHSPRSQDIVRSIISLGNDLDFQVIAEFVEHAAIRDLLASLGCRIYQGYLYSPALPAAEFEQRLRTQYALTRKEF